MAYGILIATCLSLALTILCSCQPFHCFWQVSPDLGQLCQATNSPVYVLIVWDHVNDRATHLEPLSGPTFADRLYGRTSLQCRHAREVNATLALCSSNLLIGSSAIERIFRYLRTIAKRLSLGNLAIAAHFVEPDSLFARSCIDSERSFVLNSRLMRKMTARKCA